MPVCSGAIIVWVEGEDESSLKRGPVCASSLYYKHCIQHLVCAFRYRGKTEYKREVLSPRKHPAPLTESLPTALPFPRQKIAVQWPLEQWSMQR